jgi:hypothetical protein
MFLNYWEKVIKRGQNEDPAIWQGLGKKDEEDKLVNISAPCGGLISPGPIAGGNGIEEDKPENQLEQC